MSDLPAIITLSSLLGFQSGVIASWRYYRAQRREHESVVRQYDRQIELIENELKHERKERRRAEASTRRPARRQHSDV